jgi:ribosomal-protein-alanine N-acetyltransferase
MNILHTDRLTIREYQEADFDTVSAIFSNPVTMKFWPNPFTDEQIKAWIDRSLKSYKDYGFGRYVVVLRENDQIIGDCGLVKSEIDHSLENDLGYIIDHTYWNQGYGYEAAKACLKYAFNHLELDSVVANMPYDHYSSKKVAEKLGMKLEKEFYNSRNRNILTYLLKMYKDDFDQ